MATTPKPRHVAPKGTFNGHTPRQHRATSSKGGRTRMRFVTREQQREWSRRGAAAVKAKFAKLREAGES